MNTSIAGSTPSKFCSLIAIAMLLLGLSTASAQAPAPGTPGHEHEILQSLVGNWEVSLDEEVVGSANAHLRLGDRYLEMELLNESGPLGHALYIFGFDTRHDIYTVLFFDDSGTYWVSGQGVAEGGRIEMFGEDEDPVMREMGLDKEYILVLDVHSEDHISLEIIWLDTRTPDRTRMPFLAYQLHRREGALE